MSIGRYIFKELFDDVVKKSKFLSALDLALEHKGSKIIFLLRMTPIVPFSIMNYGFGATSVSARDFVVGGFGMIPEMMIILYFGTAISSVKKAAAGEFEKGTAFIIMIIIGTIIGVIAIFYISYLAKQELDKTVDEHNSSINVDSESRLQDNEHFRSMKHQNFELK